MASAAQLETPEPRVAQDPILLHTLFEVAQFELGVLQPIPSSATTLHVGLLQVTLRLSDVLCILLVELQENERQMTRLFLPISPLSPFSISILLSRTIFLIVFLLSQGFFCTTTFLSRSPSLSFSS